MNILLDIQRLDPKLTNAQFVERLAMIAGIFANTWRAFTSLVHSDTRANIAKRNLTPKPN